MCNSEYIFIMAMYTRVSSDITRETAKIAHLLLTQATSTSPKVCGICLEDYDEERRCPRILSCFHTLCNCCIANLIADNKKQCPFCRNTFTAEKTDDVAVNYTAIDFIKYLAEKDIGSGSNKKNVSTSFCSKIDKMKNEALETIKHQLVSSLETEQQIELTIKEATDLEDTITKENAKIQHEILPKLLDTVSRNNSTLEEVQQSRIKLKSKMKEIKNTNENIENIRKKFEAATAETFKDVGEILDETEAVNASVGAIIEDVKLVISKEEKSLAIKMKRTTKAGEKSNVILDLLNSADDGEEIDSVEGTGDTRNQEITSEQLDASGRNESAQTVVVGRAPTKLVLLPIRRRRRIP